MISSRLIAKTGGFGYLLIFITGIFANFFVLESLIVRGDSAATFNNFGSNEMLFRTGILSFIIMVIADLILAWALYLILIPVNRNLSLLSGWLRLVNSAIFGVALYNLIVVLQLISDDTYLKLIDKNHLYAQMMLSLETFNIVWLTGLIFFGLHLIVLGYLIFKSDYIPGLIGILLVIAGFGMFTHYENYKDIFSMIVIIPGIIGELSLTAWLLFQSKKMPEIKEYA